MKIDLHVHTKTCSDGNLSIEEMFGEAKKRGIDLISTTDHDGADKINGFSEIVSLQSTDPDQLHISFQSPKSG